MLLQDKQGLFEAGSKKLLQQHPDIYSKVSDLPPAKSTQVRVRMGLVANGSIINGTVENSVLFQKRLSVIIV